MGTPEVKRTPCSSPTCRRTCSRTEREANLLGAFLPGFHSCEATLKDPENSRVILWFMSPHFAQGAVERLNGFQFDAATQLQAALAGLGTPRNAPSSAAPPNPMESTGVGAVADTAGNEATPAMMPPPSAYFYAPMMVPNMPSAVVPATAKMMITKNQRGNPPCNTLFIGNLTVAATEEELADVFCRFDGFVKVKTAQTRKGMSAFVEFTTVENAAEALKNSQNVVLNSSAGRGAIRVQYSKNPLGSRGEPRLVYAPVANGGMGGVVPGVLPAAVPSSVGGMAPGVPAGVHPAHGVHAAPGVPGTPPGMFFVQNHGLFSGQGMSDMPDHGSFGD